MTKQTPMQQARDRMYYSALQQGEDLSLFDVIDIIMEDRYYPYIESTQDCLKLACEIYTSCGFVLPPDVEEAMQDGERFRDMAIELF